MKVLMPRISRRELIASGLALSTTSLIARSALGRSTADIMASDPPADFANPDPAVVPREQILFDSGWKFKFGHATDPMKDMGFGYGQAQFAHMGIFEVAKERFDDSD